MTIQQRFILTLSAFGIITICISSLIGIIFLKNSFHLFMAAPNSGYVSVMADQIYLKAIISFVFVSMLVIVISIPLGIILSKQFSNPYLKIFKNLKDIAGKRLNLKEHSGLKRSEYEILNKYVAILIEDFNKIKDYEKANSWKDGARMLMHELKNPLTPLKLSAQQLLLNTQSNDSALKDVVRITNGVNDIEKILSMFKDLVNIEFGQKVTIDMKSFVIGFKEQMINSELSCPIRTSFIVDQCYMKTEPALLRMCISNLIRNGLEANRGEFFVTVTENPDDLRMDFVTPGASIEEPGRLFRPGYSSKGEKRGFGLFLCRMISDYLDLNLSFENTPEGVRFSITFLKAEPAENALLHSKK
jgi:two-component system nitrogen regulation sensor histidine kinase NtrY